MSHQAKIKNERGEVLKAGCVVLNKKGEILLAKNREKTNWTFPKGHCEEGESYEETAKREVREETGYEVEIIKRRPDISYVNPKKNENIRIFMFDAKVLGEQKEVPTGTEVEWYSITEAKKILSYNLNSAIEDLKDPWYKNPKFKKTVGILALTLGVLSVLTPFTPFGFLILVGLELLGLRTAAWDKFKKFTQ